MIITVTDVLVTGALLTLALTYSAFLVHCVRSVRKGKGS